MTEAIPLALQNVSVQIEKTSIVKDISLLVKPGECLGIIGPNGGGKTTLLQAMLGFQPLASGRVLVGDKELGSLTHQERARNISYVSQEGAGPLPFTVEAFLQLAYFPWRDRLGNLEWDADIQRLATEFKLLDKLKRNMSSLSGGERQRVILVQSLLQRPKILLLDELTNHLDISYQIEIMQYLARQSMTKIMVLHDINLAARYCDRLVFLKNGLCIASGPTAEVLTEEAIEDLFEVPCEIVRRDGRIRHIALGVSD